MQKEKTQDIKNIPPSINNTIKGNSRIGLFRIVTMNEPSASTNPVTK